MTPILLWGPPPDGATVDVVPLREVLARTPHRRGGLPPAVVDEVLRLWDAGSMTDEIAQATGVCESTVNRYVGLHRDRNGRRRRPHCARVTAEVLPRLVERAPAYERGEVSIGALIREIGALIREIGASRATVRQVLKELGIEIRTRPPWPAGERDSGH
ncbi:MAG: hypothetical protein ABFC89_05920 [Methanospirillum sp.]